MIPLATSSQRVMPPKMLKRIAVDLGVGGDHFERVDDRLGFRAAAGVEEVGRRAARLGDDVERRHAEPGAVGEDADVAVELDVGEALLLGHRLLRVLDRVGDLGQVLVAEEGVAVDRHLGVERDDLAVGGDDQRVDLDQRRVLVARHLGQLRPAPRRPGRATSSSRPAASTIGRAAAASNGAVGSMWRLTSASGSSAATASMSIPPLAETIASSFFSQRSRITEA